MIWLKAASHLISVVAHDGECGIVTPLAIDAVVSGSSHRTYTRHSGAPNMTPHTGANRPRVGAKILVVVNNVDSLC